MNKRQNLVTLVLVCLLPIASDAANQESGLKDSADASTTSTTYSPVPQVPTPITGSSGISVTGAGTQDSPYVIAIDNTHAIGTAYGGGIIACTKDPSGGGFKNLIVTEHDKAPGVWWSVTTGISVPNPKAISTTNGRSNTLAAYMQDPNGFSAIQICYELNEGGYQDWYLPAIDELGCLYANRGHLGMANGYAYWSSTEYQGNVAQMAWQWVFNDNTTATGAGKTNGNPVRCVRAFTY